MTKRFSIIRFTSKLHHFLDVIFQSFEIVPNGRQCVESFDLTGCLGIQSLDLDVNYFFRKSSLPKIFLKQQI